MFSYWTQLCVEVGDLKATASVIIVLFTWRGKKTEFYLT